VVGVGMQQHMIRNQHEMHKLRKVKIIYNNKQICSKQ